MPPMDKSLSPLARTVRRDALVLGLLILLGAALRLHDLDALSIWYDEGWTLFLTRLGPAEALRQIVRYADPHPPGYYLLLIPWMRLLGQHAWAARAFSVAAGVLTIPAVYQLGRRLYDRATGLLAAALVTLAPAHIAYSQEARMYALLGLWTVLLLELSHRYAHRRAAWRWPHWAALVVVESLALYTHFFALFLLVGLQAWVIASLCLQARRASWRPLVAWLLGQLAAALTLAPWGPVMLQRLGGHVTASTYTPPLGTFVREVWSFLLAGQIDLLGPNRLYAILAMAALGSVAVAAAWTLWRDARRREMGYLCVVAACTLLGVYLLMRLRPGFHPRYLFLLLLPLLVCVARQVVGLVRSPSWLARAGGAALLLVWLAANALGGQLAAATNPWRDDARGAAAYLREHLPAGSAVVAAYTGWELEYYLEGSGLTTRYYGLGDFEYEMVADLATLARGAPQVAYVRWRQSDTDHTGQIAYTLAREGRLLAERQFPAYDISIYAVAPGPPSVRECPAEARFGPLMLAGAEVADPTPADGVLTVALRWRLLEATPDDLKATLTLTDARGRVLAQQDRYVNDARGLGTSHWQAPQAGATYHTLALPPGTAPLAYRLQVGVYHEGNLGGLDVLDAAGAPAGRSSTLCSVELAPSASAGEPRPVDRQALGLSEAPPAAQSASGLRLAAYRLERGAAASGERLGVLLEWRNASGGALPDLRPALRLVQDGVVLTTAEDAPVYGAYPTSRWAPGEIVLEWRDLLIPAEAATGPAAIELLMPGEAPVALGSVEISAVARTFAPPQPQHSAQMPLGEAVALVGYDLSAAIVAPGGELGVTLYWQALAPSEKDLTVFVHLLDEQGGLVAQDDAPPAQGSRPTTGWLAGEYIRDEHALHWLDPQYTGMARIQVGLYDPATGERLLAPSGASSLVLPEAISVEPGP